LPVRSTCEPPEDVRLSADPWQPEVMENGINVMILKIFPQKHLAKKMAF
jgi:hypothetical protein